MTSNSAGGTSPSPPARQQSLTLSATWLMLAKTTAFAVNVALPLLIVRRLDRVEFGHYKQVFLAVTNANTLVPFGFVMTAFYFFPREAKRQREVMFNILAVYAVLGALAGTVLLAFPTLLASIFGDPSLRVYSHWIALLIPLWILSYLIEVLPVAHKEFKAATGLIIASQLSRTSLLFCAVLFYGTVRALIYAAVIHAFVQTLIVLWYSESRLPGFWRHFDRGLLREQIAYAIPIGSASILLNFEIDLHNYFVSNHFGAAVFAAYSIGCFQIPLMGMLSEAAVSVALGRVTELRLQNRPREIIALTARMARKLAAVVFPVYGFLLVSRREFLIALFTVRYIDSLPIFIVNLTSLLVIPLLLDPIMRAYPEHMPYLVKARTIIFILMVASLWLCVGRFGPISGITISVLTTFLDRAIIAHHLGQALGFRRADLSAFRDTVKIAGCVALASVLTAVVRPLLYHTPPLLTVFLCGIFFIAVYAVALLILKVPTLEEKSLLFRYLPWPKATSA